VWSLIRVEHSCGRHQLKKTRIVGGEDARFGKWPWQASLQMGALGHVCGASVISNRWLVSAAHCFLDSDSLSVCNKLYDDLITSRMLCAGNLNGGVDACQVSGICRKTAKEYLLSLENFSKF
uniref:Transmembrane serine protease 7 n=1 Tax=Malurus cyaneus samueli TaxID=2593467 RepID=A0A8C5TQN3_9PASS